MYYAIAEEFNQSWVLNPSLVKYANRINEGWK